MISCKLKNVFLQSLLLAPLLSSCALFKATPNIEIIYPPSIPDDLKSIPKLESSNEFQRLTKANSISKNLDLGREDPFLPPELEGSELSAPKGLIVHGIIKTNQKLIAIVSTDISSGAIKIGDTGSVTTNLIPQGWSVHSINLNEKKLNLKFKNKIISINIQE